MAGRAEDVVGFSNEEDEYGKRSNWRLSNIRHSPSRANIGICTSCHTYLFLLDDLLVLGSVKVSTEIHVMNEILKVEFH